MESGHHVNAHYIMLVTEFCECFLHD